MDVKPEVGPVPARTDRHDLGAAAAARRRFRRALVAFIAITAVVAVWLLTGFDGQRTTTAVDDVVETLAPLVAAFFCWRASRNKVRHDRLAWAFLAAASLSWGLGQAIWTVIEVVLHAEPFPSPADPLYLGFVPLAAAGVLALADAPSGVWSRLRLILDGCIAAGSALFVSWALVLGPVYHLSAGKLLEKFLDLAYPGGDVILVAMVLIASARARRARAFALIAAGLLAFALADSSFAYLNLAGTYNGNVLDAAWVAGFFLIALAALSPPALPAAARARRDRILGSVLPLAPVPAAIVIVAVRLGSGGQLTASLAWLGVSTAVVILGRQLVAMLELTRSLEAKVVARTEDLGRSEDRFRSLVQNSSDAVLLLGADLRIDYASDSAERVLGRRPEDLQGRSFAELVDPAEWPIVASRLAATSTAPGTMVTVEHRLRRGDDDWFRSETIVANLLDNPNVGGLVLTTRDVSERKVLEDQLRRLAFHDPLTGLANRALFRDRVEHALKLALRTGATTAVLFIDLDNFKHVNDSLGHGAGDDLLRAIGERLERTLRACDSVARLGGDEFAILAENIHDSEGATSIGERLLVELQTPVQVEGREIQPQASVGIATADGGAATVDDLLRDADVAMYQAKARGKGCWELFQPAMHTAAIRRLELETELRRAIAREEFVVHYQPIVRLQDATVSDVEALIRWNHPKRGLLTPGEFIPLAEETGLIVPIGTWILQQATRHIADLHQRGIAQHLRVAVNLSSRQLSDPTLEATVADALRDSGLDPSKLVLEITETVLMRDTEDTIERMRRFRAMGIQFAMDDFGTGYSALGYLRRYPIQILKIDRSFVSTLGDGAEDTAVVRAILSLAATLGMEVVAEGIEEKSQADQLRRLGCTLGQGFHFARPMDPEALADALGGPEGAPKPGSRRLSVVRVA